MDFSKKLGVLWQKEKNGKTYFTGNITINGEKHDIVLFANNKRPGKQDPDFQIFPSEPRGTTQEEEEGEFIPF